VLNSFNGRTRPKLIPATVGGKRNEKKEYKSRSFVEETFI
jgi:hypothetical protein